MENKRNYNVEKAKKRYLEKRNEILIRSREYYQKLKQKGIRKGKIDYIKFLGRRQILVKTIGKCLKCGYSEFLGILEFHHINPLNNAKAQRKGEIKRLELDKILLVCPNCHEAIRKGLISVTQEDINKQLELTKNLKFHIRLKWN